MGKTVKKAIAEKYEVADQPEDAARRKGVIIWLAISALVALIVATFTLKRRFFPKRED